MTRHFVGWTRPPHAFEAIPSFTNADSLTDQTKAVLLDFVHDDDMRQAAKAYGWYLAGAEAKVHGVDVIDPESLYVAVTDPDTWLLLNSGQAVGLSTANLQQAYDGGGMAAAINSAIQKRLKLGPLPPNTYDDTNVTVYYYDNDRIKQIVYPRTSLTTDSGMALDPKNTKWWSGNGITIQETTDGTTWSDEGFDAQKDLAGAIPTIISIIMVAIAAVLAITGVGAVASAAIIAWSAALLAESQMIADACVNEDVTAAFTAFINAITKFVGLSIPQSVVSPAAKAALSYLNAQMKALVPLVQATSNMNFKDAAAYIQMNLPPLPVGVPPTTDDQILSLSILLGGASSVYESGYRALSYGGPNTVDGILSVLPDADQRTLFRLGATMGLVKNQQQLSYAQTQLQSASIARTGIIDVRLAYEDLLNYVRVVLKPRYGL